MTETRSCSSCGAALPAAATDCAACGARQSAAQLKLTTTMAAAQLDPVPAGAEASRTSSSGSAARTSASHRSQTDKTLYDLSDVARAAVEAARRIEVERSGPTAIAANASAGAVVAAQPKEGAWPSLDRAPAGGGVVAAGKLPWGRVGRAVTVLGGLVLLALFVMDSELMGALGGAQLVLAFYYLVGGLLLFAGGLLPLPGRIRASLVTAVGAVPLFVAGPLVGGVGGWRGLAASLVVLVMPGALLLRARVRASRLARVLVGAGVVLAALIYLVPDDGVVPLSLAFGLLGSGSVPGIVTGALFLLPLGLAIATLTVFTDATSTGYGNLWAALVLANAAAAVVIAGTLRDEPSLVSLGIGLLAAGSAAAIGVADLLDFEARSA